MGALDLSYQTAMARRPAVDSGAKDPAATKELVSVAEVISERTFLEVLTLERKRSERSGKSFVLMLTEWESVESNAFPASLIAAIAAAKRDTDLTGWYSEGYLLGTIFTELGELDNTTFEKLRDRFGALMKESLSSSILEKVRFTFYRVPDEWSNHQPRRGTTLRLYPDVMEREETRRFAHSFKRGMDLAGSLLALTIAAPLFLLISLVIKLTSKGPVLFRQERIGQHGVPFFCLKFRTMQVVNDPKIHREYVEKLIRGQVQKDDSNGGVFKIQADPRVTTVGRFLRRTSLDELPQFLNVLMGQMSLVGPRPPIPYELEAYDLWHRRRVLEAKPGITGLWQVRGRSRTTFDEMVRLDLQYARSWSIWLDLKIILETPWAVISGSGAH